MKIAITHNLSKTFKKADEQPVDIQFVDGIDDASCMSINMGDTLDFLDYAHREPTLHKLIKKLRYGGEITVIGLDMNCIGRFLHKNFQQEKDMSGAIYRGRQSMSTLKTVENSLIDGALTLVSSNIDSVYYIVKARRNKNV